MHAQRCRVAQQIYTMRCASVLPMTRPRLSVKAWTLARRRPIASVVPHGGCEHLTAPGAVQQRPGPSRRVWGRRAGLGAGQSAKLPHGNGTLYLAPVAQRSLILTLKTAGRHLHQTQASFRRAGGMDRGPEVNGEDAGVRACRPLLRCAAAALPLLCLLTVVERLRARYRLVVPARCHRHAGTHGPVAFLTKMHRARRALVMSSSGGIWRRPGAHGARQR